MSKLNGINLLYNNLKGRRVLIRLKMNIPNLSQVGNVNEGYEAKSRVVEPRGIAYIEEVVEDEIEVQKASAIKTYSMLEKETTKDIELNTLPKVVSGLFEMGMTNSYFGLGFAILSKGVLNISMWGGEYPSIFNPDIFTFDKHFDVLHLKKRDIRKIGAYCAWEGEIIGHESRAWQRFLHSARYNRDKNMYLEDSYTGETSDHVYRGRVLQRSVFDIGLSTKRAKMACARLGIKTLGELATVTEEELGECKNVGRVSIQEIKGKLDGLGLGLRGEKVRSEDELSKLRENRRATIKGIREILANLEYRLE